MNLDNGEKLAVIIALTEYKKHHRDQKMRTFIQDIITKYQREV